MRDPALTLSTALLRQVLEGATYEKSALDHRMTRTAVERRVKALAIRLIREGIVDGLNENQAHYVRKLREHRQSFEAALDGYSPLASFAHVVTPPILSDDDVQTALRRVRLHTQTPERDVAMLAILLATGLRPLEVACLEIRDYLEADGSVRTASEVREAVAVNARARPLFFTSTAARQAIDAYLARRTDPHGLPMAPYRGLSPDDALFLGDGGRPFRIELTRSAKGNRRLCQEIHYAFRKIFRRVGYPGLSALNLRHTVMDRLSRRGADDGQIGELLGIRELRPIRRPRRRLDELMDELI